LSQSVPVAGAVVVSTPQNVALADTKRAVAMYRKLNIPVIGILENMSHFICPDCGRESDLFGKGGAETLSIQMNVPFMGAVPLYEPVRRGGDSGIPIVMAEPESPAARAFVAAAERVAQQVSIASYARKVIPMTAV
jgi:ATP-binding protein involved in chromosome partitioning